MTEEVHADEIPSSGEKNGSGRMQTKWKHVRWRQQTDIQYIHTYIRKGKKKKSPTKTADRSQLTITERQQTNGTAAAPSAVQLAFFWSAAASFSSSDDLDCTSPSFALASSKPAAAVLRNKTTTR